MANTKLTDLAAFAANALDSDADPILGVDVSDATMAPSGTNKRLTVRQILKAAGIVFAAGNNIAIEGSGLANTPSAELGNLIVGCANTQSGYYGVTIGCTNTQAGSYNLQVGGTNAQTGAYGTQVGSDLDDGGFSNVAMFGQSATAATGSTAYFWLDNGVRIKPLAGDPGTLEDGTIWITTAGTLRFRANGVTRTVTAT